MLVPAKSLPFQFGHTRGKPEQADVPRGVVCCLSLPLDESGHKCHDPGADASADARVNHASGRSLGAVLILVVLRGSRGSRTFAATRAKRFEGGGASICFRDFRDFALDPVAALLGPHPVVVRGVLAARVLCGHGGHTSEEIISLQALVRLRRCDTTFAREFGISGVVATYGRSITGFFLGAELVGLGVFLLLEALGHGRFGNGGSIALRLALLGGLVFAPDLGYLAVSVLGAG
jgi:hypothetical protein